MFHKAGDIFACKFFLFFSPPFLFVYRPWKWNPSC